MRKSSKRTLLLKGREIIYNGSSKWTELRERFTEEQLAAAAHGTMAFDILKAHNCSDNMKELQIKFDAMVGQDMTYMGVLETAIATGIKQFPIPFVLSSCHNALCYNDGTSNEDDHVYAMGAARKYGAIFLPTHLAVMHQYMREKYAGGGKMILGADSHTRYGALGSLATGEGGGELVKQLLGRTYDISYPETVLVYVTGSVRPGVGPQDVALALIGEVFRDGFVKNKILEFVGPGVKGLSVDFRNGVDVMTTESSAMFSIWETDEKVEEWLTIHGRGGDYRHMYPAELAEYDCCLELDLSEIKPMIAMPFHPSNTFTIDELNADLDDILASVEQRCNEEMKELAVRIDLRSKVENNRLRVDQGVIAGCSGGLFENITHAADILRGRSIGNSGFSLNIYPASQPVLYELVEHHIAANILESGANLRSAFCGPCFGAGDCPQNGGFSIRHTTRNFSNREGSRPGQGQISSVALMDARSIAATAVNGGFLTSAEYFTGEYRTYNYFFNNTMYQNRVLDCFGQADPEHEIIKGPGIGEIPLIPSLNEDLLLKVAAVITDPVTTTDELIPNGESSSFRSNFSRIADYTLSAKVPEYVGRCKSIRAWQEMLERGEDPFAVDSELQAVKSALAKAGMAMETGKICIGSLLYATKPGDGSAREYAASNQKVLGGWANICREFATKRYRSNLINWGILPFTYQGQICFDEHSFLWLPGLRQRLVAGDNEVIGYIIADGQLMEIVLSLGELSEKERTIISYGCLINYYKEN